MLIPSNRRASSRQAAMFGLIQARRFTPRLLRFVGVHWLLAGLLVPIALTVNRRNLLVHQPHQGQLIGCYLMDYKPARPARVVMMLLALSALVGWFLWTFAGSGGLMGLLVLVYLGLVAGVFALAIGSLRGTGSAQAIEDHLADHPQTRPIVAGGLASWPPGRDQLPALASVIEDIGADFDRDAALVAVARNETVAALYERYGFERINNTRGMIRRR